MQDRAAAGTSIQSDVTYCHNQSYWLFMKICRAPLVARQKSSGVRICVQKVNAHNSLSFKTGSVHSLYKFHFKH